MGEDGNKLLKWLMLAFNLIFWVSGIGLIIAGAIAQTNYNPFLLFLPGTYIAAPVLLIVVGATIAIIAFFGCCGSNKENYCMLMTFAVLLGIIFLVELGGGIAAFVEKGRVQSFLDTNMRASFGRFNASDNTTTDSMIWNKMQNQSACCGVSSYLDWKLNSTSKTVPVSCCRIVDNQPINTQPLNNQTINCDRNDSSLAFCSGTSVEEKCPIWTKGCESAVSQKLEESIGVIGGVGVGVAFIQLIGIVFACILARRIRRGYSY